MSGIFSDLLGTLRGYFKIGLTGVRLKNAAGNLVVRNSADSADAEVTASKVNASGDSVVLNSDAAGAGADWTYTLARPASGMTAARTFTLPPTLGSNNQVLKTDGAGNTSWTDAGGSNASAVKIDTTSLAFGAASPVAMFDTAAGDIVEFVEVVIDTAFDGAPSLSVGIVGTTSKYLSATDVDLTAPAGTVFRVHPGLGAQGVESLIATYAAGGATAGAARIRVGYANPS